MSTGHQANRSESEARAAGYSLLAPVTLRRWSDDERRFVDVELLIAGEVRGTELLVSESFDAHGASCGGAIALLVTFGDEGVAAAHVALQAALSTFASPDCYACRGTGRVDGFGRSGRQCPCVAECEECDGLIAHDGARWSNCDGRAPRRCVACEMGERHAAE